MSITTFTPGPWFCHLANAEGCQCANVLADGMAGSVATISINNGLRVTEGGNDSPLLPEAKANAALIAAAPELYAALEALIIAISGSSCSEPEYVAACKALEKASGEYLDTTQDLAAPVDGVSA